MKSIYLFIAYFAATAANVTLTWDTNPASDGTVTYRLYTSQSTTGPWTLAVDNISGTTVIYAQEPVTAFYHVTAVNTAGLESDPSNVVTYSRKPSAPGGLRVVFMDWTGNTNRNGAVTPIASVKTDPGAGLSATITGPWGTVNRSGAADADGVFVIKGKAATRPFVARAEVTKYSSSVTGVVSVQPFE